MSKKFANSPPLHLFVRRQQVLRLYRALQRGTNDLEDATLVASLREQIRFEFKNNSKITDNVALRTLIQDGQRQLTKLQSMSKKVASATNNSSFGVKPKASDSWIDQQDADDVRGRVGTNWPWNR